MSIDPVFAEYSQLDDVSLLSLYHGGDQSACAALMARYAGVISHRIKSYTIKGIDSDDLKQEAFMGFLNAVRSFDESRRTSFYTYANHCISNRLKNLLSTATTVKATAYNKSISIEEIDKDISIDDSVSNPELIFIQNESYSALIGLIEQSLSKFEKDVLFLYLGGCDYKAVAQKLDSSPKSVGNALQRGRKKLKVVLNNM